MQLLAARAAGELLLLCPRAILAFDEVDDGDGQERTGGDDGAARPQHLEPLRGPWDRQMRMAFSGNGDVRRFARDRLLLVQAAPRDRARPAAH